MPREDLRYLRGDLQRVVLEAGALLVDAGEASARVYFPEAGVVALVAAFETGATAAMATIGREGFVGVAALLGGAASLGRHPVRVPGSALAMEAARFRAALTARPRFKLVCEAYAQCFLGQVLQTVACNAVHTLEQRCARWLLVSHDRSEGESLALTPAFLAELLGVGPSKGTALIRALRNSGLIGYREGVITVRDRQGLEAAACECYWIDRRRFERLLGNAAQA